MKLFKWIFSGGNYHYVTSAPCDRCHETTDLTLSEDDYLIFLETNGMYNHVICPRDAS